MPNIFQRCLIFFFSEEIVNTKLKKSGVNWELCPPDADRLKCFYTYLSLYVRMRNDLKDPVALRNIGKRKRSVEKRSIINCPPDMDRIQCYDNVLAYYIRLRKLLRY